MKYDTAFAESNVEPPPNAISISGEKSITISNAFFMDSNDGSTSTPSNILYLMSILFKIFSIFSANPTFLIIESVIKIIFLNCKFFKTSSTPIPVNISVVA